MKNILLIFFAVLISLGIVACNENPPIIPGLTLSKIVVDTDPVGASIILNKKQYNKVSPTFFADLEPGFYQFEISMEHYLDTTISMLIKRSTVDSIAVTMREDPFFWWTSYSPDNSNLPNGIFTILEIDPNDNLWIGTDKSGLIRYNPKSDEVKQYSTQNSNIASDRITIINLDNYPIVWVGTDHGFSKYDGAVFQTFSKQNTPLQSENITGLDEDTFGNLWISTYDAGIYKYDGVEFYHFNTDNSNLSSNNLRCLLIAEGNTIFAGSFDEGLQVYDGNEWKSYNLENSNIVSPHITSMFWSLDNILWLTLHTVEGDIGGLAKFTGNEFENYTVLNSGISGTNILDAKQDVLGNFWIGAKFGGVSLWKTDDWINYNTGNSGLPNLSASQVVIDSELNKWFISNSQLVKYIGEKDLSL